MVLWTAKIRPGARGLTVGSFSVEDFSTRSHSCEVPLIYWESAQGGVTAARVNFSRVLGVTGQERAVSVCVGVCSCSLGEAV